MDESKKSAKVGNEGRKRVLGQQVITLTFLYVEYKHVQSLNGSTSQGHQARFTYICNEIMKVTTKCKPLPHQASLAVIPTEC